MTEHTQNTLPPLAVTEEHGLEPLPLREAMARARRLLHGDHERDSAPDSYPVEVLGPMAGACKAIAQGAQVQPGLVGQSLLSTAALLTSALWNVRHIDGSTKPLNLYCLTVAMSGSGKDASDSIATAAVREWQRKANEQYQVARAGYEAALVGRKKGEPPPEPPIAPHRLCADMTVEGLRRAFNEGIGAQGIFSTEAAAVLAGHGFSAEQRAKTAATLCGLWDRGHLSILRAGGGRFERYGLRLSAHLLIQPAAVAEALNDPLLSDIGLWPRFLLAWPPANPPRRFAPWDASRDPAVGAYWKRCTELLEHPVPADCTDLEALTLSAGAARALGQFFEAMEQAAVSDMAQVRPFALRATEQAARIAGVLTAWRGDRRVVGESDAQAAVVLARYSVEQWQAALLDGKADPVADRALGLYRWLAEQPDAAARARDIVRNGPRALRDRDARDEAIARLEQAGLVNKIGGGYIVAVGVSPSATVATPATTATPRAAVTKNQSLTIDSAVAIAGDTVATSGDICRPNDNCRQVSPDCRHPKTAVEVAQVVDLQGVDAEVSPLSPLSPGVAGGNLSPLPPPCDVGDGEVATQDVGDEQWL